MKNQETFRRPFSSSWRRNLERSPWRWTAGTAVSKSVPVHAHAMMLAFQRVHLCLLVGRKSLVKRSLRFRM